MLLVLLDGFSQEGLTHLRKPDSRKMAGRAIYSLHEASLSPTSEVIADPLAVFLFALRISFTKSKCLFESNFVVASKESEENTVYSQCLHSEQINQKIASCPVFFCSFLL